MVRQYAETAACGWPKIIGDDDAKILKYWGGGERERERNRRLKIPLYDFLGI